MLKENKKPNFFIIGAPKCGTTSIYSWLCEHKKIFMSPIKEPFYFDKDIKPSAIPEKANSYEELFDEANPKQHNIIGEASTRYLMSKVAVTNILHYNPESLFLVCLRNPVEMAYSLHQQELFNMVEDIEDFTKAWNLQKARKSGKHIPKECTDPKFLQYAEVCSLGSQCKNVLNKVDANKIKFVVLDDVIKNPLEVYKSILKFLGLTYDGKVDFQPRNTSLKLRSKRAGRFISKAGEVKMKMGLSKSLGFSALNTKKIKREPLNDSMRLTLETEFKPEISKLENMLERDFSNWFKII